MYLDLQCPRVSNLNHHIMLMYMYHFFSVKPVLNKRPLEGPKKWPPNTGGLLTQVNLSEKCAFVGLKVWFLNTSDLKARNVFDIYSNVMSV